MDQLPTEPIWARSPRRLPRPPETLGRSLHDAKTKIDSQAPPLEVLEDRRLLSAGDLDTTFGIGGLVTTNLGTQNASYDYAVAVYHNEGAANEGKIVAAGTFSSSLQDQDIGIVRYNLDGSLDTSFGGSGQVTTSFGSGNDGAHGVKIQPGRQGRSRRLGPAAAAATSPWSASTPTAARISRSAAIAM